jgi:hypothetical protein
MDLYHLLCIPLGIVELENKLSKYENLKIVLIVALLLRKIRIEKLKVYESKQRNYKAVKKDIKAVN